MIQRSGKSSGSVSGSGLKTLYLGEHVLLIEMSKQIDILEEIRQVSDTLDSMDIMKEQKQMFIGRCQISVRK